MRRVIPAHERVLQRVNTTDPERCWLWQGAVHPRTGYGTVSRGGQADGMAYVHRVIHEALIGPIPYGYQIDHLCRVRHCVNPSHLEAVTQRENLMRGNTLPAINAAKTHCAKGHPFSGPNLIQNKNGSRACRTCKALSRNKGGVLGAVLRESLLGQGA